MIYALATRRGAFGIGDYLKTDGRDVAHLVTVLTYEDAFDRGTIPIGAYLFTGLEELTKTESVLVGRVRQALAAASPSTSRFNDPVRWYQRGDLLQAAFCAGVNGFRAIRPADLLRRLQFPVFVRSESQHTGALSPLLFDRPAVLRALLAALIRGHRLADLLIVEYCHTADAAGVYAKYSAMILGSRIVPRSLTLNRDWVTKFEGRITDPPAAEADLRYVDNNPHEAWLRRVCELGGVEYGRVDYGVLDGRLQLWEINTNPTIGADLAHEAPTTEILEAADRGPDADARRLMQRGNLRFYARLREAWEDLSGATRDAMDADGIIPGRVVSIPVSGAERRRLDRERSMRARVLAHRTAIATIAAPMRRAYRLRHRTPQSSGASGSLFK